MYSESKSSIESLEKLRISVKTISCYLKNMYNLLSLQICILRQPVYQYFFVFSSYRIE